MHLIQRFSGGLNLNIHFHTLRFDGVFYAAEGDTLDFRPLPPSTDDEGGVVLAQLPARVQRLPQRRDSRDPRRRRSSSVIGPRALPGQLRMFPQNKRPGRATAGDNKEVRRSGPPNPGIYRGMRDARVVRTCLTAAA